MSSQGSPGSPSDLDAIFDQLLREQYDVDELFGHGPADADVECLRGGAMLQRRGATVAHVVYTVVARWRAALASWP